MQISSRGPIVKSEMSNRLKKADHKEAIDEEVKDDENIGEEATESTQLESFAKSAQVVVPRQMSHAIQSKHSLMHSAFPDLVSPRNVRLQEESDSGVQRIMKNSAEIV